VSVRDFLNPWDLMLWNGITSAPLCGELVQRCWCETRGAPLLVYFIEDVVILHPSVCVFYKNLVLRTPKQESLHSELVILFFNLMKLCLCLQQGQYRKHLASRRSPGLTTRGLSSQAKFISSSQPHLSLECSGALCIKDTLERNLYRCTDDGTTR
jgi:hypothetical protein